MLERDGRAQVIVPGMNRVRSYDLETGEVIWHTAGLTMNPIPSPVADDALVYLMSGFRGNSLKAIRVAGAKGDITGTDAVQWTLERDTPYVPSPLLYDGIIYFLKSNNGMLSAYDARTGKPHFQVQRLPAAPEVFASPVGAAGRIYIPRAMGRRSSSSTAPRWRRWRRTSCRTDSMRLRRWSIGRSTCGATSICTALRSERGGDGGHGVSHEGTKITKTNERLGETQDQLAARQRSSFASVYFVSSVLNSVSSVHLRSPTGASMKKRSPRSPQVHRRHRPVGGGDVRASEGCVGYERRAASRDSRGRRAGDHTDHPAPSRRSGSP